MTTNTPGALLSHLWRGGQWAYYWTNSGNQSLWFPVDKIPPIPARWARQNVYFGVHPCREIPPTNSKGEVVGRESIRVQNAYVAAVNGVFAEFDAKDFDGGKAAILAHLTTFPQDRGWPYPSVIVDSGGGFHAYWLLEDTVTVTDENRDTLRAIQAAWVTLVGGDNGAKDFARVLRVPGTLNIKPEYGPNFPTVTIVEADYRRLYALAEFARLTEHLRAEDEGHTSHPDTLPAPTPVHLDDEQLLERAKAASNGADFERLWNGGMTDYGNDHSSADMALCCHLAFWTGRDTERMDRMFRASALMRPKWDVVHHSDGSTYGGKTISRAIGKTNEVYTPTVHKNGAGPIPDDPGPGVGNDDPAAMFWQTVDESPPWADAADTAPTIHYSDPLQTHTDTHSTPETPVNGHGPGAGNPSAGDGLLAGLASIGDDREALTFYALDSVPQLAELDAAGFARFSAQLVTSGLPSEWVRKELRPAVNAAKKRENSGKTWTDYVQAAQALGYNFRLNDLSDTVETNGERLTDVHEAVLLSKLHAQGLKSADVARRAFTTAAAQQRYHPIKTYLERLNWDGEDHIAALAGHFTDKHDPITYPDGTQRTVFHAFFRRWLVGAVGKVYDPTKCQNPMLILAGGQGKGKSYFVKWLCPLPELHIETPIRPEDKDYLSYLTTRWVWEVGELGATIRKADREALKAFITLQDATFRPAYGRHALVKPALASFVGTVNPEGALLSDPTGHRRFWPVELKEEGGLDWGYTQAVDRNQVWAQAFALYRGGEPWALSAEERAAHAEIVELYEVEDILAGYIQEHFSIDRDNEALFTTTTDIIATLRTFAGLKDSDKSLAMQLSISLNRLKLQKTKRRDGGTPRWGYVGIAKQNG